MIFFNIENKRGTVGTILSILFFAFFLSSCFTGVESTPKIGNSEVKSQHAANITPEQAYLATVTPMPLAKWEKGKEFIITDSRIAVIFTRNTNAATLGPGNIITFDKAVEAVSPVGAATDIYFINPTTGDELVYRVNATLEELKTRSEIDIPFTVEKKIIDDASAILSGKNFYILTQRWNDDRGNIITRIRYIPVTIREVGVGTPDLPLKVLFKPQYEGFGDEIYYIFMTVGSSPHASRNFNTIFSIDDPRKRYPHITNENWKSIIMGKLTQGMTREEARLALGAPNDVDRGHDYSSVYERWIYDGGIYLIFRDGILEEFRQ